MGLADRDYMRERRAEEPGNNPFTPPKDGQLALPWMILFWAAVAGALYALLSYVPQRQARPQVRVNPVTSAPSPNAFRSAPPTSQLPSPERPVAGINYPSVAAPPAQAPSVSKCVVNGVTTYSDQGCALGASEQRVTLDPNRNLAVSLPRGEVRNAVAPVVAPLDPGIAAGEAHAAKATKIRCDHLEARIKAIDEEARKPQSAQTQDLLAARRKEYRDEQFRLKC